MPDYWLQKTGLLRSPRTLTNTGEPLRLDAPGKPRRGREAA